MKVGRLVLVTVLSVASLSACVSRNPHFDQGFGTEVRTIASQQVRDPNAATTNAGRAVDGIDGKAAKQSMDRYQRSFGEPPRPANVLSIGLGAAEAGGGSGGR
jgi:3-methyladenine DNA glycosylase/8-oxoguanine DNA glycosylase